MKIILQRILNSLGYEIRRTEDRGAVAGEIPKDFCIATLLSHRRIVDLDKLALVAKGIPGMVSPVDGRFLFALAYLQSERGDVVEIGSWQGRSTSFLARATRDSENGAFFAIDHFKGNVGKEHFYVVGKEDLSDLETNFRNNMRRIGLDGAVNLLNASVPDAVRVLETTGIRFLFIDGDHSEEGVRRDLDLFFPKLVPGALVVFDDFTTKFPGVSKVVDDYFERNRFRLRMSYANTLVVKI